MTTIYLVRHGETAWNAEARIQGHLDVELNETGIKQAEMVAEHLKNLKFDAIYSSDLKRALDTAKIITKYHETPILVTEALRETYLGDWQGMTISEIEGSESELLAMWYADSVKNRPPGGENLEDLMKRVTGFLEGIIDTYPDGKLLIVAHGGSIRAIICNALGATIHSFGRIRQDNASISIVTYKGSKSHLILSNDTGHLK